MREKDFLRIFRQNLKNARPEAGLNQSDLAKRAGVSPSVVRRIENGERQPLLSTLYHPAKGLGVSPASLLDPERRDASAVGVTRFAAFRGVSTGRIRRLAIDGRIEGARKVANKWQIPLNARILPAEYEPRKLRPS